MNLTDMMEGLRQAHINKARFFNIVLTEREVKPILDEFEQLRSKPMIDMFKLHEQMTKRLFPSYASEDERFLTLALCGEAGELANMIKKRWRDGVDLREEIRDELADIRVYLELLAKCFDLEGEKLDQRVQQKLEKVVEKFHTRLKDA